MSYYKTCPQCGSHLDPGEACDCARERPKAAIVDGEGEKSGMDDMERRFLLRMRELSAARSAMYLAMVAMLYTTAEIPVEPPEGYTRGDFKRAIRVIRESQAATPNLSEEFEKAAALIRRDWLHREEDEGRENQI